MQLVSYFKSQPRLGAVHKLRLQEEGGRWSKQLTFCKLSYHTKCEWRGVSGQRKTNFVNVVWERPLSKKIQVETGIQLPTP